MRKIILLSTAIMIASCSMRVNGPATSASSVAPNDTVSVVQVNTSLCLPIEDEFNGQIAAVNSINSDYCSNLAILITAQGHIDALAQKPEATCQKVLDLKADIDAAVKNVMSKLIDDMLPSTLCAPAYSSNTRSMFAKLFDVVIPSACAQTPQMTPHNQTQIMVHPHPTPVPVPTPVPAPVPQMIKIINPHPIPVPTPTPVPTPMCSLASATVVDVYAYFGCSDPSDAVAKKIFSDAFAWYLIGTQMSTSDEDDLASRITAALSDPNATVASIL